MIDNIILATDSYKLNHWNQYPKGTETVYSYFESRPGAKWPYTIFFGLQYLLKRYLEGQVVTEEKIEEAKELAAVHFGSDGLFNEEGWRYILEECGGVLPLKIKAVPEGTVVPQSNVMMTVENTDPKCFWLTNAVESLLVHAWYPSTVATLSAATLSTIEAYLDLTAESKDGLPFMLHDFGYRGASSHESAAIGGAAHLINSRGTDTLPAMLLARDYYNAQYEDLAFSVPATEHSVMTARGPGGEIDTVDQLIEEYPNGILSVVADSYNTREFVDTLGTRFKDRILARGGKLVIRPDSGDPVAITVMVTKKLWDAFGGTINDKGFMVLDPHVGVLWGDGIDSPGINQILKGTTSVGFSAENYVFGMGGGLLQKVNRDTQSFAFKCSAQKRNGQWHDVYKDTKGKESKRGRLELVRDHGILTTIQEPKEWRGWADCGVLQTVFLDGILESPIDFAHVRENARK